MSKGTFITPPQNYTTTREHSTTRDSSSTRDQNSSRSSSNRRRRPSQPKTEHAEPTQAAPVKADAAPVSFAELGVPAPLVDYLRKEGKTEAFPIQQDTLPDTLGGRDVLGRGKTGSGKTLAFSLPMVARLAETTPGGPQKNRRPRGLILAPTRELATQITNVIDPLAQAYGMKTTTIFGGVKQRSQEIAIRAGVDIIVACPGRLEDLLQQGIVTLDDIEITVLDEADHMADMGFLPSVTRILARTPENGQRMFFSATLDNDVNKLVRRFLHNEVLHSVDDPSSHVSAMTHHLFEVADGDKNELVQKIASGTGRRILFTRTKHRAKRFARQLTAQGIPAVDLHGNLSQGARDRNLAAFSEGDVRVLVATDVAARGVHVDSVELVVHVDPPTEHKAYLHRSGRTARAGSSGAVVTIMVPEERKDTLTLLRKAAITVKPQRVTAESPEVAALVGDIADFIAPQPKETKEQPTQSSSRKRAPRRRRGGGGESAHSGQQGGRSAAKSQDGRSSSGSQGGRRSESSQGGRKPASAQGNRRNENSRSSRAPGSAQGGRRGEGSRTNSSRQGSDSRGTSPESRQRNRSRGGAGGSRTVYSTNS
ncbi:DEAD/DEAH box helicase [Brevibacterium aurantiacum]|nr:DEAD/DEAH box helicase [Brevibacterium aurantiacum]RCS95762.1 DEAD/DEAH box helicase [Brevibacterium aurantiacum]